MLLTISTTYRPATDFSYLLHKHPDRVQSFALSFGQAHVFYPAVTEEFTEVALLLDVDPVGIARAKTSDHDALCDSYVNDRPYVSSSFMSVAIAQVFGSALGGRCKDRPQLVSQQLPLTATLDVLPVRAGQGFLQRIFEPLGYSVEATRYALDNRFPEWGLSPYYRVRIVGEHTLSELLTHLYVLIPVFDNNKHFYVGEDERDKLLQKGAGWLAQHPEKEQIARRYLKHRPNLYRSALARLMEDEGTEDLEPSIPLETAEASVETRAKLNDQRLAAVLSELRSSGAAKVIDLGCGEGKLLRALLAEQQFTQIVGLDVASGALEIAHKRLNVERLPPSQAQRLQLIHGSLMYRDSRLKGFDAAAVVEVIEHLDPPRLTAFERVVFEFARPRTVALTTPNREYNIKWPSLPATTLRHADHRFEWTRSEFQEWAQRVAVRHSYRVRFEPIGEVDDLVGPPTQMAVFTQA